MNYQERFSTFREATRHMFEAPTVAEVAFIIVGLILTIMLFLFLPYWWSKYRVRADMKKEFFRTARSMGLVEEETALLWQCRKSSRDPLKVFQNKHLFERCVGRLVRKDASQIETVARLRKKLGFDSLPWFMPLTSSREIELYQTGFIALGNSAYSSAVWEKTEVELHIALLDNSAFIKPGDRVKFSFLREDDGRYYFQGEVLRIYRDGKKLVLVLPHVEELSKIQLRASPRWRVKIPCRLSLPNQQVLDGIVEDISPHGVRVCIHHYIQVQVGDQVSVEFELKSHSIQANGIIKHVKSGMEKTCMGLKFENLDSEHEEYIRQFILEEQRELLKTYKTGETKGGFSS